MLYGYKGKLLHIDLGKQSSKTISIPLDILKKYIGGRGLGAKLYWDLISPEAAPLGQKNILMVLTGPLGGTMVIGSGKHVIITKSPATGGWLESYSSGRVTPELKFAGYDGLIVTGKSEHLTGVIIKDNKVEFSDASFLRGKGAFETETYIRENFHPECGTLSIGPAGENLLPFACIGSDYFRKAGRGGSGAVMGSKNLKFIAVKGSGGINCANMEELHNLTLSYQKKVKFRTSTPMTLTFTNSAGMLPTRNFSKGQFQRATGRIDINAVNKVKVASRACYACFAACASITKIKEGEFKGITLEGPEYETLAMQGANLEIDYLPAILKANYLCDDLGMDTISSGVIIGFVMECYERGIITRKDTEGLDLKFGNYKAALELLELMAHKKGFGASCAQGVKKMAKSLGHNTEHFAIHCKGLEFPAYDPRAGWSTTITYSVTPRGGCHRRAWPPSKEILGGVNPFTIKGKAEMVRELMNERCVLHSLLICDMSNAVLRLSIADWARYLNVVTGLNYSKEDLIERAEMIETLIRRINIREGFSSKDDYLPKRILEESHPDGPTKGKIIGTNNFLKMREDYYLCRGWNSEGVPTPETIDKYQFNSEPSIKI
ncbi:MAG: aldehyde ferredoxin oxidoreductase family protein [Candidatus Hodarchaeota archaeon]